jgi:hypothetical protein
MSRKLSILCILRNVQLCTPLSRRCLLSSRSGTPDVGFVVQTRPGEWLTSSFEQLTTLTSNRSGTVCRCWLPG